MHEKLDISYLQNTKHKMKALIACEESQRVCVEFRKLGHEAYSCDIEPCSGEHPEWHIQNDVLPLLNGNCSFKTVDGKIHKIIGHWDMIIAFPPCTHLAVSGAKHFEKKRIDGRQKEAVEFFAQILTAECKKIAVENPVGIISGKYIKKYFPDLAEKYNLPKKPSQIIQPYMFGHRSRKNTCLWLKGLPKLKETDLVQPDLITYKCKNGKNVTFSKDYRFKTAKDRSKTYQGVAKAMADQWGGNVS